MKNRIGLTKEQKIMAARIVLTVLLLIIGAGVFGRTKGYAPAGIALFAAASGASIVRVHDVRETAQAIKVWTQLR